MTDRTNWGPRQAVAHLVSDLEQYCDKRRDEQIDRAIRDFSARGRHERPDAATADQVTILADYFGVSEEYFWNPDVVESWDRRVLGGHALKVVRDRYVNGFRRSPERLAPPEPMPDRWWTDDGMATVNSLLKDAGLKARIMEWFSDELDVITALDDAISRIEARRAADSSPAEGGSLTASTAAVDRSLGAKVQG